MPTLLHPDEIKARIAKLEHDREMLFHHYDHNPKTQGQIDAMSRELFELRKER